MYGRGDPCGRPVVDVGATLAVALLWMGDPSSLFSHSGRPFLSQVAYKQATLPTRALKNTCSRSVWYY